MSKRIVRGQEILDESPVKTTRLDLGLDSELTNVQGKLMWRPGFTGGESIFVMSAERSAQLNCRMTHPSQSGICKHCAIIIE